MTTALSRIPGFPPIFKIGIQDGDGPVLVFDRAGQLPVIHQRRDGSNLQLEPVLTSLLVESVGSHSYWSNSSKHMQKSNDYLHSCVSKPRGHLHQTAKHAADEPSQSKVSKERWLRVSLVAERVGVVREDRRWHSDGQVG